MHSVRFFYVYLSPGVVPFLKDISLGTSCFPEAIWSANTWLNLLAKAPMFLSELEDQNRLVLGRILINSYATLAADAAARRVFLFRLRPKFHLLDHCTRDVRASRMNCHVHSTWMDEDSIKRYMKLARQVHKRTAAENILQRFTLGLRTTLDNGMLKMRG